MNYHVLRTALSRFGKSPAELDEQQITEVRNQALREYNIEQLILNSAEGRDVHVPDSVVEAGMERISARYPDSESFMQDLTEHGMNEQEFRESIRREMHATAVLDRVGSRAADISELDCMIYYHMHKERFDQPETREVYHILITINEEFPENQSIAARKRIEEIQRRVKARPRRFTEQALKHSECPTALQGGQLGNLPRGQLYPELDKVLFAMRSGEVSEVVQSQLGYHILYCKHIQPAGPVSFRKAEARIREHLRKRRMRMCQKSWLNELTKHEARGDNKDG